MKRISTQISTNARAWYFDRFGSIRFGCMYVLEAFPRLYRKSLREVEKDLGKASLQRLIERLRKRCLEQACYDGSAVMAVATEKEAEALREITGFSRACIELAALAGSGPRPEIALDRKNADLQAITPDLSETAVDFLHQELGYSTSVIAAAVLELFPSWFGQVMNDPVHQQLAGKISGILIDDPLVAGNLLLPMNACLSEKDRDMYHKRALFVRACLELAASPKVRNERQAKGCGADSKEQRQSVTTRVTPIVHTQSFDYLEELFSSATAAASFAFGAFTAMYQATLCELGGVFTGPELRTIAELMEGRTAGEGFSCGQVLPALCREQAEMMSPGAKAAFFDRLAQKLEALPAFSRSTMEVWGQTLPNTEVDLEQWVDMLVK